MVQPDGILGAHHVRVFSREQQAILVLRATGVPPPAIGAALGLSEGAVRSRLSLLQTAIMLPLGLRHDGWLAGMWVGAHLECCLAEGRRAARELLEVDQNFRSK